MCNYIKSGLRFKGFKKTGEKLPYKTQKHKEKQKDIKENVVIKANKCFIMSLILYWYLSVFMAEFIKKNG
ncbi:exporter of the RND superfamily [Candidatus Scalindua japonica]|uniref:Exporter of the RND superfamily n=1 Tax=Candidatus Scalindua japonica TaxID=1284222 RepID=A0A286TVT9_9BACT|nr:exporter of the RND superfamily [Candidatus Scalindua japonica]